MAEDFVEKEGTFQTRLFFVDAKQHDGTTERAYAILAWVYRNGGKGHLADGYQDQGPDMLHISVGAEDKVVIDGHWVVKTRDNKFRVWSDEGFRTSYEPRKDQHG